MKREADIYLEKHSLFRLKDLGKENPAVKLIGTFKDECSLYFLTEMLNQKDEVWAHCRTFGMLDSGMARFVFEKICEKVQKMHSIDLVHRDLKPENMFFSNQN